MKVTASQLRNDIYRMLDEVIDSGIPLEIERRGKVLRIVPPPTSSKLSNLERRDDYLACDPEELVHLDWSGEWKP